MPFSYDPEVGAGLAALFAAAGDEPLPPVGDVATRRKNVEGLQTAIHGLLPMPADVTIRDLETTTGDGATILLRWYAKDGAAPGSAVLYAHGGGMILSNVPIYDGTGGPLRLGHGGAVPVGGVPVRARVPRARTGDRLLRRTAVARGARGGTRRRPGPDRDHG